MSKLAIAGKVKFAGITCTTDIPDNLVIAGDVKTDIKHIVFPDGELKNIWRVDGFNITGRRLAPKNEEGTIKYYVGDEKARAYIAFSDDKTISFIQELEFLPEGTWLITDTLQLNWQGKWNKILFAEQGWGEITTNALSVLEEQMGKFLEQKMVAKERARIDLDFQARQEVLRIEQRQEEMERE